MREHATAAGTELRPLLDGDLPLLVAFMLDAFPSFGADAAAAERFYRWKYFDTAGRDTGNPTAFAALDASGIAGFLGALPFWVRVEGKCHPAAWICDWRLAKRARGRGLGRALLDMAMETIPMLACINGSADAEAIYRKRGFHCWAISAHFIRIFRPFAYEWPRRTGARRLLGILRGAQLGARRAPGIGHSRARSLRGDVAAALDERPCTPAAPRGDGPVHDAGYVGWIARSPVASVRTLSVQRGGESLAGGLAHVDVDRYGRRRGRILQLDFDPRAALCRDASYDSVAMLLRDRARVVYLDLKAPLRHAGALAAAGFTPAQVDRLWLAPTASAGVRGDEWELNLLDKDDAFRDGIRIP